MSSVKKIAIVGGESTGKSTLCTLLADYYGTVWVPEYARAYLENLTRAYIASDLVIMAKGQIESEKKMQPRATNYLFCDTDMHVFKVWSEYKFGMLHEEIAQLLDTVVYEGYIVTAPDFPWQPDVLREHPSDELRQYFFKQYVELVNLKHKPVCVVYGSASERLSQAITFLSELKRIP